jgi:hypothetical protein
MVVHSAARLACATSVGLPIAAYTPRVVRKSTSPTAAARNPDGRFLRSIAEENFRDLMRPGAWTANAPWLPDGLDRSAIGQDDDEERSARMPRHVHVGKDSVDSLDKSRTQVHLPPGKRDSIVHRRR